MILDTNIQFSIAVIVIGKNILKTARSEVYTPCSTLAINKRITEQYEISWFDITPISREAINNPVLVAADGLHPSGEMYRQWVELIYESVKGKLNLD